MNTTSDTEAAKDRLVADFKAVVSDAEELLKATANQTGERITAARARIGERLDEAKRNLAELEDGLVVKTRAAAKATDQLVREHPWQSVAVSAALGYLLGLLTNRR